MHYMFSYQKKSGLFLLLILLLTATGSAVAEGPAGPVQPPAVTVTNIIAKDINPTTEYVGRTEAVQSVDILARVEGFIEKINFHEGDLVKTGDILYVIEQAPYRAQVAVDEAKVAKAQATLQNADQYLNRLHAARSDAVSQTDIETAVSDQLQAQAALQEARATLLQSKLDLDYTVIKAPISGRIGKTDFNLGSLVKPDSGPLAHIVQLDPIRVLFSVSENKLPEIMREFAKNGSGKTKQLKTFQLQLPNGDIYPRQGKPDFMDNQIDSATGTIAIRVLFANPDMFLLPGQFVTVISKNSEAKHLAVVPQAAVLQDRQGNYVLVLDKDNRVEMRRITKGDDLGTDWAVLNGLQVDETVIVQGIQKVRPGMQVQPVPEAKQQKEAVL